MKIFVGNLSPEVTDQDLEETFGQFGKVRSTKVIRDMFSQVSKGFGFLEMMNNTEAANAIKELNTFDLKGKKLVVNEARPQLDKRRGRRR